MIVDASHAVAGRMCELFRGSASPLSPSSLAVGVRRLIRARRGLAESQCRTIDDVIGKMTSLGEQFETENGPHDGVLCFNRLYLEVTRGVKNAVEQHGYFNDPEAISRLDVIFAQLYFDAVDGTVHRGRQAPPWAWKVLFESRGRPDVFPIQFAAAGMNAHINRDLPLALLHLWDMQGARPTTKDGAYADYVKINQILKEEERKAKSRLAPSVLAELERLDHNRLGRLDDKLALWVVEEAREHAWHTADHLWHVRRLPSVRRAWLAAVDVFAGALGRTLLEPV
jgi:Family of unknown function (DUF5995)